MTGQQLKNSILQLAVQGKLVPQDPADEPASILLERIREEKEQLIKDGKIKKEKNPSQIFRGEGEHFYERIGKAEPICIDDELPFEIPESWEWARLDSFTILYNGRAYKQNELLNSGKYPVLRVGNLFTNKQWFYSDLELEAEKYCDYEDLLYSWSASFGPHIWNGSKVIYHYHIWKIEHSSYVDKKFLYYLLLADTEQIKKSGHGLAMIHVTKSGMEKRIFPLPPLAEQQRIVAKIEELMPFVDRYDKLEKQLQALNTTFPDQLKRSILQESIQGKLVPQDPTDEPANTLLERIRAEKAQLIKDGKIKREKNPSQIFRGEDGHFYERIGKNEPVCIDEELPFEIPETWEWARLKDIALTIVDCPHSTPKYLNTPTDFYAIDTNCINAAGEIIKWRYVDGETYEKRISRLEPQNSDIIYTREGSICRAAILPKSVKVCLGQRVMLIRVPKLISYRFIRQYLMTSQVIKHLTSKQRGIGAKHVNVSDVCALLIPLPPLAEQQRIVAKLEQLLPLCEHLK